MDSYIAFSLMNTGLCQFKLFAFKFIHTAVLCKVIHMISKHKYYESSYLLFVNKKYLFKNVHSYEKYYTFLYTSREFYSSLEIFRYRNEKVFSMKIFVIP